MMSRRCLIVVSVLLAVLALPASAHALQPASVPSAKFQSAQTCYCHGFLLWQWTDSMHAKALSDPLYIAKVAEGDRATGGKLSDFCNDCHGPIASMAGEIRGTDVKKASAVSREGVTCDFCHHVTGLSAPLGDVSMLVTPDNVKRAQLADAKSPAHGTAFSAIHRSAEFCGACHDVNHPGNGMHLETAYSEWKKSPYAAKGVVCQDCHMSPQPGTAGVGAPQRKRIYMMDFVGANAALGDKAAAEQLLRSAATIKLETPEKLDGSSTVSVKVRNAGAGHYLPTGLTEVRQMWLQVTFSDRDGKEIGTAKREYGTVLKDAKGKHPVELWDAVGVYKDDRIPPMGESVSTFPVPFGATSGVYVKAALYYRSASEELAKKADVEVPTTLMASAETYVPGAVAEGARAEGAKTEAAAAAVPEEAATDGESGPGRFTGLAILLTGMGVLVGGGILLRKRYRVPEDDEG